MAIIAFEIMENNGEYAASQPKFVVAFSTKGASKSTSDMIMVTHLFNFLAIKFNITGGTEFTAIKFHFIGLGHIHGCARKVFIKEMLRVDSAF